MWWQRVLVMGMVLVGVGVGMGMGVAADEKPKSISKIMRESFLLPFNRGTKNNLDNKLLQGKATAEEKQQLLDLLKALAQHKPPKGDAEAWKKRTTELVAATEALIKGEENAAQRFTKARDCRACHIDHRPDHRAK